MKGDTIEIRAARRPEARAGHLVFAAVGYSLGLAVLAYFAGFLIDLPLVKTVDRGSGLVASTEAAVALDLALVLLFGVQHSVMARPWFKRWLTAVVPERIERATYVWASSLTLGLLMALWAPLPAEVWSFDNGVFGGFLVGLYAFGWFLAVSATFCIDHLELFGLRQAAARASSSASPRLIERFWYRVVRHPITLGWLIVVWATPEMSAGHLLLAVGLTWYCLVATTYEERDLESAFGAGYREYRRRVPALLPRFGPPRGRRR